MPFRPSLISRLVGICIISNLDVLGGIWLIRTSGVSSLSALAMALARVMSNSQILVSQLKLPWKSYGQQLLYFKDLLAGTVVKLEWQVDAQGLFRHD